MFKKYRANEDGRDFVVGDIHGCFVDLVDLLVSADFDEDVDRLFAVGDLTDRGPESRRAMEWLDKPWFHSVFGNHESIFVQVWGELHEDYQWHMMNGGEWALEVPDGWRGDYVRKLKTLPLIIQVGEYGILHALPPAGVHWDDLIKDPFAWEESILWDVKEDTRVIEGIKQVIVGHHIHEDILERGNIIDIDTGSFKPYWNMSGKLSMIQLNHGE